MQRIPEAIRCLRRFSTGVLIAVLFVAYPAAAATRVALPSWVCAHPDAIFVSGYENAEVPIPHSASGGSSGMFPGDQSRTVSVTDYGDHAYYLYIPTDYSATHAWPLVVALEGAAGSPTLADSQAQDIRNAWATLADSRGVLVAVPVASGSHGGWIEPDLDGSGPSDYDMIASVLADAESAYNIERTRIYAWGFSAGGDILHDIVLTGWAGMNANSFAGYAVTGAVLAACPPYSVVLSCIPANATRTIPLDIRIGKNDSLLTYARSDKLAFLAAGWTLNDTLFYTEFSDGSPAGGHIYTATHMAQAWSNLCSSAVTQ
jgi:poly(3-hydroxybutyrate) depolymerase